MNGARAIYQRFFRSQLRIRICPADRLGMPAIYLQGVPMILASFSSASVQSRQGLPGWTWFTA